MSLLGGSVTAFVRQGFFLYFRTMNETVFNNHLNIYKQMNKENAMTEAYEAPQVRVIEVEVEKGFAVSDPTGEGNGFGRG